MKSILVNKIVQTEGLSSNELLTTKSRIYTFLILCLTSQPLITKIYSNALTGYLPMAVC